MESLKKRFPVIREKYSGEIRLDEKVLSQKLGSGKLYFIHSMGDLFADNVKSWYIMRVINWLNKYPDNTYLLQSKNPTRFREFNFPKNIILCTTIESNKDYEGMSKAPCIQELIEAMIELLRRGYKTFLTIEPIMEFDLHELVTMIRRCHPISVNIGADSGNNKLPEPSRSDISDLITELQKFTTVKQKKNLNRLLK